MSTHPLVLLAHGSCQPGPSSPLSYTAEHVSTILQGTEARTGYVELQPPDPATALEGLVDPVVLPFFLARGYHVIRDISAAMERHGLGTITGYLGVEKHLAEAVIQCLYRAPASLGGIIRLNHIVLGAVGSHHAVTLGEVKITTHLPEACLGREVTPVYLSTVRSSVYDAVGTARARGARRVGVVIYLLVEGRFHRALRSMGTDVVATPVGDHPALVELVVHRYRGQAA